VLGSFVNLVDENGALIGERGHHMFVVHNLFAHVYRSTKALERFLDGDNGTVNTSAVSARGSEQNALRSTNFEVGKHERRARDAGHA
jgi:hypothetical protein